MAVLVTGVGYIGARLIVDLLKAGKEVVAIDNFFSTDSRVIAQLSREPHFRFVRGNVGRPSVLKQAFESVSPIDTVFSLAAQASAHPDAASPRYTENTNLLAPRLLLEAMLHYRARTLVYASSFRVYGDELPPVVTEDMSYGRFGDLSHLSKCYVEKLMEMYAGRHDLRCLSIRLGVVYGLGAVMKRDYAFMTAPNKFCLQAVRGEKIVVYGAGLKPTGFIHVEDAARAMQMAADCQGFNSYTAINAVTEIMPVSRVAEIVAKEGERRDLEVDITIEDGQAAAITAPTVRIHSKLDVTGFKAGRDMRDGVEEMFGYFLGTS